MLRLAASTGQAEPIPMTSGPLFKPVQGLTKELSTFLVEGSYLADAKFAAAVYESRAWSDFELMSPNARQLHFRI